MTYDVNDQIINKNQEIDARKSFVYGSTVAFCTLGLTTDLLLGGKWNYMLLCIFTFIEILSLCLLLVLICTVQDPLNY